MLENVHKSIEKKKFIYGIPLNHRCDSHDALTMQWNYMHMMSETNRKTNLLSIPRINIPKKHFGNKLYNIIFAFCFCTNIYGSLSAKVGQFLHIRNTVLWSNKEILFSHQIKIETGNNSFSLYLTSLANPWSIYAINKLSNDDYFSSIREPCNNCFSGTFLCRILNKSENRVVKINLLNNSLSSMAPPTNKRYRSYL